MDIIVEENKKNIFFGHVRLKRITLNDNDIIRSWRNSERIKYTMVYRKEITHEQQIKWFKNLKNENDYYYLILVKDEPAGLVNLKNLINSSAEAGVFIGNDFFDGKGYGFVSVFLINYFAFNILNLDNIKATILDENESAIRFNKSLGYNLESSNDGVGKYLLTKESFNSKYTHFQKMASMIV